jgi:phosphatidylserine decarboxylase
MTVRSLIRRLAGHEGLNFFLTNRLPRVALTRLMGCISKIELPLVRSLSIGLWRLFTDLDLSDAKKAEFRSLHDCFTRELREGARRVDPDPAVLASPSDGIVGAAGRIEDGLLLQAKGSAYRLGDLLHDPAYAAGFNSGSYVTLRLTSAMYHRFHAPHDCRVEQLTYITGDAWNVNPPALARVERLYCRNERAVIRCRLAAGGQPLALVPVAAILVASIRLHFVDVLLHLRYRGPNVIACDARLGKGEEMGWFEHGSTIIVLAPAGFTLLPGLSQGMRIRMGEPLLRLPPA